MKRCLARAVGLTGCEEVSVLRLVLLKADSDEDSDDDSDDDSEEG